jgi:hypothetical protein
MKTVLVLTILGLVAASTAYGKERAEICAKYRTSSGWSQAYKVDATIIKGYELNQATGSYSYQGYDTYVVIFWDQDEASVIQMESPYVTYMDGPGYDQQGRAWQIHKGSFCI